jgi:methionyl-tRNA formyltransferase
MKKLKTVFFGTPDFSVPTLKFLFESNDIDLTYVVSMPDRPAGRGHKLKSPEVIEFAKENDIPYFQTKNINNESDFLAKLDENKPDLFIVLAFAQFLKQPLLDMPTVGCFNIHTSILPKYRGAAPIQYALLNGDKETGVSIQKMVLKMDAGDLVAFDNVAITPDETGGSLYDKLKNKAPQTLLKLITDIKNNSVSYTPQDEAHVSFAPTLNKQDGKIDFKHKTFEQIRNQVKALSPWPGTWCMLNGKRLKVYGIEKDTKPLQPGETHTKNGKILVGCHEGSIRLIDIQLEGKKRTFDRDYLNGHQGIITIE